MRAITVTGAILMITGWFALVEFDTFSEEQRKEILQKIKTSPSLILLIGLMPLGILINIGGAFLGSIFLTVSGATLIFIQGMIVSTLILRRKRWKGILLLSVISLLGIFIYIPLFIH
ncbi:hypothetical protein ACE1TF_14625 [Geomicrobium sp. JSM 1781026]|uniref:hypothetical protein n=1 Tax=Geomicrobium sp. JSM 1781026 TaxID=3344580 RepID=UPI0035C1F685